MQVTNNALDSSHVTLLLILVLKVCSDNSEGASLQCLDSTFRVPRRFPPKLSPSSSPDSVSSWTIVHMWIQNSGACDGIVLEMYFPFVGCTYGFALFTIEFALLVFS